MTPSAPEQDHRSWYAFYFNTRRGQAALERHRADLCRYLWSLWSPDWDFDDAFDQTADSFDNPDFIDTVVHSYRHRYAAVAGDPSYEAIEARLAEQPAIRVPSIALMDAVDGVNPPWPEEQFARHFSQLRQARILPKVGHNPPQEAPDAFAEAVLSLG